MRTSGPATPVLRSWRAARLRAAAPRVAFYLAVTLLAAAGLRGVVMPRAPRVVRVSAPAAEDLGAESFAQAFARAYLSWTTADATVHDRQLAGFLPAAVLGDGSPVVPGGRSQRVAWTAAVSDEPAGARRRTIVVEAETDRGTVYVSVPVARDGGGFIYVSAPPALVGGPPVASAAAGPDEPDVSDPELGEVLRRAITNYVEGQASDLRADLAPGSFVSLPPQALAVRSIDQLTWAGPGRAAVSLTAVGGDGTVWTLRYELGVSRRDRWYVTSVAGNPAPEVGN